MTTYTIFDVVTRMPVSIVTCDEAMLSAQVGEHQIAIEGRFDPTVTRLNDVDLPQIHDEMAEVVTQESRRAATQARIEELERKQARRIRELLAASDPRLQAIEAEISALRSQA